MRLGARRRDRPVWQTVPPEVRARFDVPLPVDGEPTEAVFEAVLRDVLPYPLGNTHPRFWGWVLGTGTASGVLADLVASTMNPNTFAGDQAAVFVETQVLKWSKAMLGYPEEASGVLVDGASMGNLVGLAVARHAHTNGEVAGSGLWSRRPMTLYASTEVHVSVPKAVDCSASARTHCA